MAQRIAHAPSVGPAVELREFGRVRMLVDGREVRPRIAKSYELLAYLIARGGEDVQRSEMLDVLFDGRADESTRAYVRQALHQLRSALPEGAGLVAEHRVVRLGDQIPAITESTRFEAQIAEASRLCGEARLTAIEAALAISQRGVYLPGVSSEWAEERRRRLSELAGTAREEAAELAFAAGRHADARRLNDQVLDGDPFREGAWRLRMRIAGAFGDDDGVVRAYQHCERALASLATTPSATTHQLLERLRR